VLLELPRVRLVLEPLGAVASQVVRVQRVGLEVRFLERRLLVKVT